MLPTAAAPVLVADDVGKAADVLVGQDDDVTPLAAVAAARPAFRHARLAAEGHAARPAVASLTVDGHSIDEHNVNYDGSAPDVTGRGLPGRLANRCLDCSRRR